MPASSPSAQRLERLRGALTESGYDAFLSDSAADIFYFTGCPDVGGHLLIHARSGAYLLTSAHDAPQARGQAENVEVQEIKPGWDDLQLLSGRLRVMGSRRVAVSSLSATLLTALDRRLSARDSRATRTAKSARLFAALDRTLTAVMFQLAPNLASGLRRVKEPKELEMIRQAARIVEAGMAAVRDALRPGVRELDVAAEAEYVMRRMGQDGRVFETKVQSGWRSAWPSTYASEKVIESTDLVLVDIGPRYRGYFGDLSRTFVVGDAVPERRRLLESVVEAQAAALAIVRAGATGHAIDAAARQRLAEDGYGDAFLHHTGHGLGLAGDAAVLLAPGEHTTLLAGECITIEPGAYVEGIGGVRIEDAVLVTETGCELLTNFGRRLEDLIIAA
jgi:Xaa-Pro aminopeptidase